MDNEELVTAIRNGADRQNNMERLYLQNKGIMLKIARRYAAFADIDDLMQEAYFALENAVNTYDNTCGAKFTTHLSYHLKGAFFRFIGQNTGVHMSARDFERLTKYKRISTHGLTDTEMCAALNISQQQLYVLRRMYSEISCLSLNECYGNADEQEMCLQDIIPSSENVEESCIDDIAKQGAARELWNEVERLGGKQAQILKARYKYLNTRSAAAENIGVSLSEARVLERKAIAALRKRRKLLELAEVYDCLNYRSTGLSAFRSRQMSNVEYVTLKKLEIEERLKDLG